MIKNEKKLSSANLFLIELIIIITFFIISLTIIVSIFTKANSLTLESTALNSSSLLMQTNAEQYKLMSYDDLNASTETFYYDKNWQSSSKEDAYYKILVEISIEDNKNSYLATFKQNALDIKLDKEIFNLETKKHYKKGSGD